MHARTAPIAGREQRNIDAVLVGGPLAPPRAVEIVPQDVGRIVGAVCDQLLLRQGLASIRLAGLSVMIRGVAVAVLHGQTLLRPPVVGKTAAQDAPVVRAVAIIDDEAFPWAYRGEMRRPQRGHAPLRH